MIEYSVVYFDSFVDANGEHGKIKEIIKAENEEEAAFLFNKNNFNYFKNINLKAFSKLSSHFKFWGLTINNFNFGKATLDSHKENTLKETLMRK